ncbi:uncharacterized protein BDZ99DRAFT_17330 [Mytilinidion resinicola]|uniref:Uncharacterized protein n=1 Tax=Mytilinidion resinicola TaxID=574789 RepID=A0A6A6Z9Y7_9PEZI|nr:uncharacterized protein BDZ99DRAFT_17330 [Mytilinidion resinicola]KAF2817509.1 hypothetical protein BDZ99DRAFT_17330 [Mytilinidion resinicola]
MMQPLGPTLEPISHSWLYRCMDDKVAQISLKLFSIEGKFTRGPSFSTPCRIQGLKLGSNELLSLGSGSLTPAQPQLRLEHERLSSLNGKRNCLGAHWDIELPVL